MTVAASMESYAARLASFNVAHQTTKKRTSEARGKTLKWPHKKPSPPELARAGFFYRPSSRSSDNTTCYLCQCNLDDWEEEDNPVEEHLKHGPSCGWAITVSIEQNVENGNQELENPMSEKMRSARQMTFGSKWPHENKRGWTCKTQKMADAGWHYCPTLESDDFVKCSYCHLSLDGWEPKDNPHDEHQRRSPDCAFFTFSVTKPKTGRAKKGSASATSRLSTLSNITAMTEGVSVGETEPNQEESVISITDTAKPIKSGKRGKKGTKSKKASTKAKGKPTKAKHEESQITSSFVEAEDDDFEVKVAQAPAPTTATRKRKSEEIGETGEDSGEVGVSPLDEKSPSPPRKRRATRASSSVATAQEVGISGTRHEVGVDTPMTGIEEVPQLSDQASHKSKKGSKKRASSTARKVSAASTASKASLRAFMPDDEEIDAALEADLNRSQTDEEGEIRPLKIQKPEGRRLTRTKPGSKKAMASVASTRRGTTASTTIVDNMSMADLYPSMADNSCNETVAAKPSEAIILEAATEQPAKTKSTKAKASRKASARQPHGKADTVASEESAPAVKETLDQGGVNIEKFQQTRSRQASRQLTTHNAGLSIIQSTDVVADLTFDIESSALNTQTAQDDSGHETDASVVKQGRAKRGSRRIPAAAQKAKAGKKGVAASRNIEDIVQPPVCEMRSEGIENTPDAMVKEDKGAHVHQVVEEIEPSKKQPRTGKATVKSTEDKKTGPKRKVTTQKASVASTPDKKINENEEQDGKVSTEPPSAHSTPRAALSLHSSDAENQPPSSRPSSQRPPLSLQSPLHTQVMRLPLAPATPTSSPSKGAFSKLQTTCPWTMVDLEHIFQGTPASEKENNPFVAGNMVAGAQKALTSPEKTLSVEQWIQFNAQRGEEKLRNECERLVGKFEGEGMRALRALEGIMCAE